VAAYVTLSDLTYNCVSQDFTFLNKRRHLNPVDPCIF